MIDKIKVGDGVFIRGLNTPGVVIELRELPEESHYLVAYGNLVMRRKEKHWFSESVLLHGCDYGR